MILVGAEGREVLRLARIDDLVAKCRRGEPLTGEETQRFAKALALAAVQQLVFDLEREANAQNHP